MANYCGATRDLDAYLANRDDEDAYDNCAYQLEDDLKATFREEGERIFNINTDKGVAAGAHYLATVEDYDGLARVLIATNDCEGLMELFKRCVQDACEGYIDDYVEREFGKKTIEEWMAEHDESKAYEGDY